jgi:hypothetical protein
MSHHGADAAPVCWLVASQLNFIRTQLPVLLFWFENRRRRAACACSRGRFVGERLLGRAQRGPLYPSTRRHRLLSADSSNCAVLAWIRSPSISCIGSFFKCGVIWLIIGRYIRSTRRPPILLKLSWLLLLLANHPALAKIISQDFSRWTTLGSATKSKSSLFLTTGVEQSGAAWADSFLNTTASFNLSFVVALSNPIIGGADGFAFVVHNDPRGTAAIGSTGGFLAILSTTGGAVAPSAGVAFSDIGGLFSYPLGMLAQTPTTSAWGAKVSVAPTGSTFFNISATYSGSGSPTCPLVRRRRG